MNHEPEFTTPNAETKERSERAKAKANELARCYARVFLSSADGRKVLASLTAKFPPDRLRFAEGRSTETAAFIDGQASVLTEIQSAIKLGAPDEALPS